MAEKISADELLDDLQAVVRDAESLLKATAAQTGPKVEEVRARAEESVRQAKVRLGEIEDEALQRAQALAEEADKYVRGNPWAAVGIAAGVALVLGLLSVAAEPHRARPVEPTLDTPPDDSIRDDSGPVSGLFKSLTNLLAKIIAIAQTRLELLTTELQEEMHRVAEILVWTIVALLAAGMGLLMASLAIIFAFWDTHRVLASVLVTAAFFGIAIVAAFMLRDKVRSKPPMLDATRAELAKDRAQLMNRRS